MDIGKTIRKSREKLGLSQKDLAKAFGVFSVDGKSFIKQAGCGELISLNRDYAPIPLTSAAVYPQGRIIGVLDPAWIVR